MLQFLSVQFVMFWNLMSCSGDTDGGKVMHTCIMMYVACCIFPSGFSSLYELN
jgi:predicted membrane protein